MQQENKTSMGLFIRFQPTMYFTGDAISTNPQNPNVKALLVSFPMKYVETTLSGSSLVPDFERVCRKHNIYLSSVTQVIVDPKHAELNDLFKGIFSDFLHSAFVKRIGNKGFVKYIKSLPPSPHEAKKDDEKISADNIDETKEPEGFKIDTIEVKEEPAKEKEQFNRSNAWRKSKSHKTISTIAQALERFLHKGHF